MVWSMWFVGISVLVSILIMSLYCYFSMLFYLNVCLISSLCYCIVVCTVMLCVWLYCHFGNHVDPRKNSCCYVFANGDLIQTNKQTNKRSLQGLQNLNIDLIP